MTSHNDSVKQAENKAKNVAQEAQAQAQDVKETAQTKARQVADTAQEKVVEVTNEAEDQARRVAHAAEDQARDMVSSRKSQVASELDSIAQAFRTSGDQLNKQEQDAVAKYANQMADQVEQASSYLRNRSIDQMLVDAEDFARQQPEIFLAGAFGLGVLASRFFKSSRRNQYRSGSSRRRNQGYDYDYDFGMEPDEYELARRPRPLPRRDVTEQGLDWE